MKKAISLLLGLIMVFSLGVTAFAAEPNYETITGDYKYLAGLNFLSDKDPTYHFTYSDEYFTHSGYEYNHKLCVMTMDMIQSLGVSVEGDWSVANKNFVDLINKCGFKDIDWNYYSTHEPTSDSIGVSMANKQIVDKGQKYTLLAIGVRGHGYGSEWASNFTLGYESDHQSFAEARDQALDYIKEYISKYNIKGNVKIWLTGYSRSAITANMMGGAIDQGYNFGKNIRFNPDDLYCYTFEAPQGTSNTACHDSKYWNIHNIINANDLVPVVSLSKWGHSRFGVDYYLPCRQFDGDYYYALKPKADSLIGKMDTLNIGGIPLDVIDNFHYIALDPVTAVKKQNVTQVEFFPEVIDALLDSLVANRAAYVDNVQADLRELGTSLLGTGTDHLPQALVIFGQKFVQLGNLQQLFYSMTIKGGVAEGAIVNVVIKLFMDALNEAGCVGYDSNQVRTMLTQLVPKLLAMFANHPDTVLTLLGNILNILCAHCPEIGVAWLAVTPAEFFEAQSPAIFTDIAKDSYCYDATKWAYSEGIAKGFSSTTFAPDQSCTRGQVVTFLWRAAGCPTAKGNSPFTDVSASSPYAEAIAWAAQKGIAKGFDATHFKPNGTVSRAQFVTFLWRYEGQPSVKGSCSFTDVDSASPYYSAIVWAAKNNITKGFDASHFRPNDACTRGQVVSFIYRDMA